MLGLDELSFWCLHEMKTRDVHLRAPMGEELKLGEGRSVPRDGGGS